MSEILTNIVSVSVLAAFFEVSERTVQNWVSINGAPKPSERGEYDFLQFVKWRLNFLGNEIKKLEAGGDKKYELEAERLQLTIQREKVKFQKELKQLVPIAEVRQAYVSDAITYRNFLEALEKKLFLVLNPDAEARKKITEEINDVRNQIGTELRLNEKEDADDFGEEIELETDQQIKESEE